MTTVEKKFTIIKDKNSKPEKYKLKNTIVIPTEEEVKSIDEIIYNSLEITEDDTIKIDGELPNEELIIVEEEDEDDT